MSEQAETPQEFGVPEPPKPPSLVRRIGCFILLVIWFTFILSPCILVTLASQGEITISQGELPGQQIRIWLLMEIEQRGIGFSSTSVREQDGVQCLQTDVNFLLWQGEPLPISYCECFTRADSESAWTQTSMTSGVCVADAGE